MTIRHEPDASRYVYLDEAGVAAGEVEYQRDGDTLRLLRAEVPMERRGEGLGLALVRETLEMIRDEHHGTIQPICPFIAKFMVKNPEFQALRA
ncbi:MAG: hypothetical protein CBC58_00485 [Cellulomonadaceae bacterium TMED98]|nr:MAG: hypothetical protein CBC58_00485 [Cellulomonadaceae bacterium TMED98]